MRLEAIGLENAVVSMRLVDMLCRDVVGNRLTRSDKSVDVSFEMIVICEHIANMRMSVLMDMDAPASYVSLRTSITQSIHWILCMRSGVDGPSRITAS